MICSKEAEVFRKISTTEEVARQLCFYKKLAGDQIAVIRADDSLAMSSGKEWERMGPGKSMFQQIFQELDGQKSNAIVLIAEQGIAIDFSQLEINRRQQ